MNTAALKALLVSLLLAASAVRAEPNCWAANVTESMSSDGLPIGHPSLQPQRAVMDAVEAMARPNPGLLALPEVRLRIRRDFMNAIHPDRMPREAVIHAHGFGPKAWGRGDCELIAQADRLGPRAGFSVFINAPAVTLNRWEHDEQLVSYLLGDATPAFQGWPTYSECAVISKERRLPWIPVTVGEMLAYFERDQQRKLADWDREHERSLQPYDLAAAERKAASIRPLNAQAADMLLLAARTRKDGEARNHEHLRRQRQINVEQLEDLRSLRAGMSPAQLDEPYRVGSGRHRLPTPAEAGRALQRVVKLDPDFPWDGKNRGRIQLLTVCAAQLEKNPRYHPSMRAAVAALDFARLAALLN